MICKHSSTVPVFALSGSLFLYSPNKKTNTHISECTCHPSILNKGLLTAQDSCPLHATFSLSGAFTPLSTFLLSAAAPQPSPSHFLPSSGHGLAHPCSFVPLTSSGPPASGSSPGRMLSSCAFPILMGYPGHMQFKVLQHSESCCQRRKAVWAWKTELKLL